MHIIEVTESYESAAKIFVTIRQDTENGWERKQFEYLINTGSPTIEFRGMVPLKPEERAGWTAEEVEAFAEMKRMADEEAQRRFEDAHSREMFGL